MPDPTRLIQGLLQPVALRTGPLAETLIVAHRSGKLVSIDSVTAQLTPLPAFAGRIAAFDVSASGLTAYVASNLLGLWRIPLDGGAPRQVVRRIASPRAVLIDSLETTLSIAEGQAPSRLLTFTFEPPQLQIRGRGLSAARGLVQEQVTGRFLIAEAANGGRLVEVLANGTVSPLVGGLGEPVDLAWQDETEAALIVADAAGGRILRLDLSQPLSAPVELYTGLAALWGARPLGTHQLAIGAGDSIFIADVPVIQHDPVEMQVPADTLFISGWVRVPVIIHDPTLSFDDLDFLIEPLESGALVSRSRDNSFDPAQPTILLSAGWATGEHSLTAVHRPTRDAVGRTPFEVLANWTDLKFGPSIATFGSVISGPDNGTWGGPDSGDFTVPQNVKVHEALGTRNVAVVLVDTASARYPTGAAFNTIITSIQNEMVNGVIVGGQNRSVADYFNQASNGLFNINVVDVVGPLALPNTWNSYFWFDDPAGDGSGTWDPVDTLDTTIIAEIVRQNTAAAQAGTPPLLDLSQMDSLIYVIRSRVSPPDPDLFVWPRASLTTITQVVGTQELNLPLIGPFQIPVYRGIARLWMPDDWTTRTVRQFHETVAHELSHNLGLLDQYNQTGYTADATGRITGSNVAGVGSWELMTWEQGLPLPSAAHRLMLGWLKPAAVRLYNFGVVGPMDETITLHAAGAGAAPPGHFGAAEVRLEDGKNYYFEYRPTVAGRMVDTNPIDGSAVLGTEALTRLPEPTDRAQILLVSEDADAMVEAGSFQTGQDFRDRDTTTPGFEQDFIVDVTSTTADAATIRVRYAPDAKPDPAITPWSPSQNWQSPDLEIVNGRNQADVAFRNIPWEGHDNFIHARVTNHGKSDAHGVTVKFFGKDFTFGGGNEVPVGEQTQDIPQGATVTFVSPRPWRPEQLFLPIFEVEYQQHACVVARFDPFLDPVTNIWEVTPENNEAQSNYTWMASTTSSPATREVTTILAENPFDKPATISFTLRQPNPLFRVYLSHRWVRLEPGEQQRILLMTESLLGDPRFEGMVDEFHHHERRIQTTLRLSAYGDTGVTCAPSLIGGVSVLAMTGLGTHFEGFESDGGRADGFIVQNDTGLGVDGRVIVSVLPRDTASDEPELVREAEAVGGQFRVELGRAEGGVRIQAHYLGRFPWMPSDSKVIEL